MEKKKNHENEVGKKEWKLEDNKKEVRKVWGNIHSK